MKKLYKYNYQYFIDADKKARFKKNGTVHVTKSIWSNYIIADETNIREEVIKVIQKLINDYKLKIKENGNQVIYIIQKQRKIFIYMIYMYGDMLKIVIIAFGEILQLL